MKGFIVYQDYITLEDQTSIRLFGRLENNQSFVALNKLNPYFFITEKDFEKISKMLKQCKTEKVPLTNFKGERVVKISLKNQQELNKLAKEIHNSGIHTYEADIKPHYRFIIDNNLLGSIEIEGDYESSERIDRVYNEAKISPAESKPKLKVISLDIESDKKNKLFCIGLSGENYQKNFMVTENELENAVSCSSESDCLEKFKKEFLKLDPDIITGWNVIDFDFAYLSGLFKKHKIPFDLGRSNEPVRLRIESEFFRQSSADIPGRQVLDGLNLIRDPFIQEAPSIKKAEFESYTLEDVAQAILGKGKILKGGGRHEEIEKLYKTNQQKLVDYNLLDCELAYEIIEKTKMIELAVERSHLTGISLDKITSSIIAFDSLYIREARKAGLVSPSTAYGLKETKIKGAYVYSSKPGIYHNVLVLDFKSLYPSVIRTFNIDPSSHLEKKEKDAVESPNKEYFKNKDGILPKIIEKLHQAREKAKREKRELSNYAIKIIMNSFWGVLASPNCRYFNFEMANAITSFCRWAIQLTAKKIEEKGYKVIYIDTDAAFVETSLNKEKANALGLELQDYINSFYKEYVKTNFNRTSALELEFDKQYLSLMIPSLRQDSESEKAAKKRYAGLIEENNKEELEIVGLEAIRGDWTDAAQEFQKELLMKVFHKESIEQFIKSYIKKILGGKVDDKLVYRKSIRKALNEYTKTTPPHVKAARQLDHLDSNVIEYYMTSAGPEPIQKLKHKIDYEHYIEKQIKPIANQILSLFNKSFEELTQKSKQTKLF
ncbi:MAG: DNA polymerase II [Nanoarchaeota archaeon]